MKVQGTQPQKPAQIEKTRMHEDGSVDITVRWDITEEVDIDAETGQESPYWDYEKYVFENIDLNCPENKISSYLQIKKNELILKGKAREGKLTKKEKEKYIDLETGKIIDSRLHIASGLEEQIGILRYSITELYNRLGETVPPELESLNTIANEEIQAGQDKKANL